MIPIYIQHHPSRPQALERLLAQIPEAQAVVDDGPLPPNPWRGYQACLREFLLGSEENAVILQDDAIVCRNFPPAVERIVEAHPETPVCLFIPGTHIGKKILENGRNRGDRYCTIPQNGRYYVPVVAMIWPRAAAERLLDYTGNTMAFAGRRFDDGCVGFWMRKTKETILATCPSLVEHPDDMPSTIERKGRAQRGSDRTRVALTFIGRRDPLEFDWS